MNKWFVIAASGVFALGLGGCLPGLLDHAALLQESFQRECERAACGWHEMGEVEAVEGFHSGERAVALAPGARIERAFQYPTFGLAAEVIVGTMVSCRRGGALDVTLDSQVERLGPATLAAPAVEDGDWAWSELVITVAPQRRGDAGSMAPREYTLELHNAGSAPCAVDDVLVVVEEP